MHDFEQISLKRCDVIISHNRLYYDYLPSDRRYEQKAIPRQTQKHYKQKAPLRLVNKMMSASEKTQLHEIKKARAEMRASLKPSERAFLSRRKRFQPDEAEALLYGMDEEVKQAREAFKHSSEWGNPADLDYIVPTSPLLWSCDCGVCDTDIKNIDRKSRQVRGINVSTDIMNDLNDYGTFSDDIAPDRRKYDSLSFANIDEYVRISGATPYLRKLERYMKGVFYLVNAPKPDRITASRALWFIWKYHRHNMAEYARMSLDTATAKDSQIDNTGKDGLQKIAYYVRLRALARACLVLLDYWAYESGNAQEIAPTFTA